MTPDVNPRKNNYATSNPYVISYGNFLCGLETLGVHRNVNPAEFVILCVDYTVGAHHHVSTY